MTMSVRQRWFGAPLAAAIMLLAGLNGRESRAVTRTWDGGAGDGLWSSSNNWDPNGVPVPDTDDVTINTNAVINLGGNTNSLVGRTVLLNDCTITNGFLKFNLTGTEATGSLFATNVTFTSAGVGTTYYQTPKYAILSNCYYVPVYDSTRSWRAYRGGYLKVYGGTFVCYGAVGTYTYAGETAELLFDGGGHYLSDLWIHYRPEITGGTNSMTIRNASVRVGTTGDNYWHLIAAWDGPAAGRVLITLENCTNEYDNNLLIGNLCTLSASNSVLEFWHTSAANKYCYNYITNSAQFDGEGLHVRVKIDRAGAYPDGYWFRYEVAGEDLGTNFAGFHDNFSVDRLTLDHTSNQKQMLFTNAVNNSGTGAVEALYTDVIQITNDFVLNLNSQKCYYKKTVGSLTNLTVQNGALTQVTGATLIAAAPYVFAPEGAKRFTRGDAPLSISNDYGTVFVSGFSAGRAIIIGLTVSGAAGNVAALRTELGASSGDGYDIKIEYPAGSDGGDMFFDWNFSHRSVTLNTLEAVPMRGMIFMVR